MTTPPFPGPNRSAPPTVPARGTDGKLYLGEQATANCGGRPVADPHPGHDHGSHLPGRKRGPRAPRRAEDRPGVPARRRWRLTAAAVVALVALVGTVVVVSDLSARSGIRSAATSLARGQHRLEGLRSQLPSRTAPDRGPDGQRRGDPVLRRRPGGFVVDPGEPWPRPRPASTPRVSTWDGSTPASVLSSRPSTRSPWARRRGDWPP